MMGSLDANNWLDTDVNPRGMLQTTAGKNNSKLQKLQKDISVGDTCEY